MLFNEYITISLYIVISRYCFEDMFTGNDENDLFSEEGTKKEKKMPHCRVLERSGHVNVKQLEPDICLHGMYIL